MEKDKKENRVVSLNENLYDQAFLEELEVRLETDPLLPGGLINLVDSNVDYLESSCEVRCECFGQHISNCDDRCGIDCGCFGSHRG